MIDVLMCERGVYGASLFELGPSLLPISMQIRVSNMGFNDPRLNGSWSV